MAVSSRLDKGWRALNDNPLSPYLLPFSPALSLCLSATVSASVSLFLYFPLSLSLCLGLCLCLSLSLVFSQVSRFEGLYWHGKPTFILPKHNNKKRVNVIIYKVILFFYLLGQHLYLQYILDLLCLLLFNNCLSYYFGPTIGVVHRHYTWLKAFHWIWTLGMHRYVLAISLVRTRWFHALYPFPQDRFRRSGLSSPVWIQMKPKTCSDR